MAVDTNERRMSAMNVVLGDCLPFPDGGVSLFSMKTFLRLYSEIGLSTKVRMRSSWDYVTENVLSLRMDNGIESFEMESGIE